MPPAPAPAPLTPAVLGLRPLATHPTDWEPDAAHGFRVAMNLALDGCIVPTLDGGARADYTRVIVMDGFLDDVTRRGLLDFLTAPGWAGPEPPPANWERATCDTPAVAAASAAAPLNGGGAGWGREGPEARAAAAPAIGAQRRTWGLRDEALARFASSDLWAKVEAQSRLCKVYPEALFAHMPSAEIQAPPGGRLGAGAAEGEGVQAGHGGGEPGGGGGGGGGGGKEEGEGRAAKRQRQELLPAVGGDGAEAREGTEGSGGGGGGGGGGEEEEEEEEEEGGSGDDDEGGAAPAVDCAMWVANAAVAGDSFSWHVDADPCTLPDSPWVDKAGRYFNREPGRPVFVSLLVYLDESWPRDHDAETLVLDASTDCGVFVRPKAGRAVLMHQDAVHRLSPPSAAAGRPRYSLVWKLVMLPRDGFGAEGGAARRAAVTAAPAAAGAPAAEAGEAGAAGGAAAGGGAGAATPVGAGAGGGGKGARGSGGGLGPPRVVCLARPEWGEPVYFGSAARLRALAKATATASAQRRDGGGGGTGSTGGSKGAAAEG